MIPTAPDDRDVLAGEYVLGLLDPDLTRSVEAALPSDPDLAGRVLFWEERLHPANAAVAPLAPDPSLWARIERDIAILRTTKPRPSPPVRTAEVTRAPPGARWRRVWASPAPWRATTALATAAAVLLAVLPHRPAEVGEAPTRFFALLQTRDVSGRETGPGWLIQVAEDGTVRSLPLADVRPGNGRALQLWTLWDQGRGPVSLGVLPSGGSVRLPPERLEAIGSGQLFEITLEPEAGSPTGRPTGRVLFIGRTLPAPPQAL